nr:aminotransferase class V-fold PLP-dependent enzyme [Pseudoclavibacter chungangensis]
MRLVGAAKPGWLATIARTRGLLAELVGGRAEGIAFTQNTSTGLALVTGGLDWRDGDNVVVPAGEFPSNAYPWQVLRRWGVELREAPMRDGHADLDELATLVDRRTRVVSLSAVQYTSGHRYDLARVAEVCRRHEALVVVDGTQAVGAVRVDADAAGIDVLAVAAHKWILGPAGIGFVHVSPRALERLHPSVAGWRSVEDPFAFDHEPDFAADARRLESGTENAAGIAGLAEAVGLVLELGRERVERTVLERADELTGALESIGVRTRRDADPARRSGIVVATTGGDDAAVHARLLESGVRCALRGGLRFAPHVYNDTADITRAVELLTDARDASG